MLMLFLIPWLGVEPTWDTAEGEFYSLSDVKCSG